MVAVAVHARHEQLVAEHPFEVDLGGVDRHFVRAAGDARPDQRAVQIEHLHRAEALLGVAGGFKDQVWFADTLSQVVHRLLLRADVGGSICRGDLGLAMRSRFGGERVNIQPAQLEHHRGEQPDLTGSQHEGAPGSPDLQPLLGQIRLLNRFRADAGRFR